MNIKIKLINEGNNSILPSYQTIGAAGMDICACINSPITLKHGAIELVPAGIAIALPAGYECQVRSRSGLAAKHGIFALNAPGTIDSDYRGEIKVILANFGKEDYVINPNDRIAQIVIAKYERIDWQVVQELNSTERGSGGFGSTGNV